jgi:hypothetical protein
MFSFSLTQLLYLANIITFYINIAILPEKGDEGSGNIKTTRSR